MSKSKRLSKNQLDEIFERVEHGWLGKSEIEMLRKHIAALEAELEIAKHDMEYWQIVAENGIPRGCGEQSGDMT